MNANENFNKNLNANDGLLANLIAQKENTTFDVAIKKIEEAVSIINRDLKLNKRISLNGLGTLFLDTENRAQFEPENTVNYLLGSYGLAVFQKQPIQRATIEEKITKELVNKTVPLVAMNGRKSKKWAYAAAVVALGFVSGWMGKNSDLSADLNYANLNLFKTNTNPIYTPSKSSFEENDAIKISSVKEQIALADENTYFLDVTFDESIDPIVVQLKEKPVAKAVSTYVAASKKELRYHLVAGCFSEKRNAKKMVKSLKKQGFDAFVIGKRKGLWAVSYNSFITRQEAVNALELAQQHNDKAWILNQ